MAVAPGVACCLDFESAAAAFLESGFCLGINSGAWTSIALDGDGTTEATSGCFGERGGEIEVKSIEAAVVAIKNWVQCCHEDEYYE